MTASVAVKTRAVGRGLCVTAILGTLMGGAASGRNVALLVGVGQFKDPYMQSAALLGTGPDVEAVRQTLTQRWGFDPKDVVALRDQEATHDRVLAEISALEQRSAPGDNVLIYYSGHGTSANDKDTRRFDLPYDTGAWVPYDVDQTSAESGNRSLIIGRRDLVPRLKRLDEGGRWVVVVSDSCFSGQVVRSFGRTHAHTRYLRMRTRDLGVSHNTAAPAPTAAPALPGVRPPPPPYPYQHVLLLSGASDSETGADISSAEDLALAPTIDNKFHGAFTDAFLRLLNGQLPPLRPGDFTYAQAQSAMATFLENRSFTQTPQILPALAEDPQGVQVMPFFRVHATGPAATPPTGAAGPPALVKVRLESVSAPLKARIAALNGVSIVDQGGDLVVTQKGDQASLAGPAGDPIATTAAADPNLIQRITAQSWLNRALPVGSDSLGLRAETDPGSRGNTFVQCESFAFVVRLQKSAYVMIIDLNSEGNLTVLYPSKASEREIVAGGAPRALPSNDPHDRILVTPPFGTDQVAVVAFEKQPAFFADLNSATPFGPADARADALARGLSGAPGSVSVQTLAVRTYPGSGTSCGS